jgi:methionyl-tRNA formyltransferase
MERDLKALSPDFILLGGIGLLSRSIISCARFGVINSHPGLLPWLRNVGVVGNAFLRDVPVGVTCHYVNDGIDKGDIIERRLLPIIGNETTLDEIEVKANEFASQVMADVVARIAAEGRVPPSIKQAQHFPPCHWLTSNQRIQVEKEIASGRARELYESWRAKIPYPNDGALPADFEVL